MALALIRPAIAQSECALVIVDPPVRALDRARELGFATVIAVFVDAPWPSRY